MTMKDHCFDALFPAGRSGFVELDDGRLLAIHRGLASSVSHDHGRTWSEPQPLVDKAGRKIEGGLHHVTGIVKLASNRIGISYEADIHAPPFGAIATNCFSWSDDQGQTWSDMVAINRPDQVGMPYHDSLVQLTSGRLVQPVRACYAAGQSHNAPAYCMINGRPCNIEGHAHSPEMDITFVHYSDDEGQTWQRCEDSIFVWLDDGYQGVYACDEPTLAQANDGRLVLAMRSTIGRIIEAWSNDGGQTWTRAVSNALPNSYSPCRIRRIPTTGDLHMVWNQVSANEIRGGYRRSRLSSAISTDNGKTWINFKTLDCCSQLNPGPHVESEEPPRFVIARQRVGQFPADYCIYRYPNVRYAGNTVYFMYDRECVGDRTRYRRMLRAMPIDSLYHEEPWDLRLSNHVHEGDVPPAVQRVMQGTLHIEA